MDALEPWLALFLLPDMHCRLFHKLLEVFGSPGGALAADPALLRGAGLKEGLVDALRAWQDKGPGSAVGRQAREALEWRGAGKRRILVLPDAGYPPLLKAIPDPPPLLFVEGDDALLHRPQVALVGSRTPTAGGVRLARRFAAELGREGLAVTSGLALGIDRESHVGALESGAPTVAVLGSGVDRVYPKLNRSLAQRILDQDGAIVSEFPLGTEPQPWHFPQRNRIISGLSLGVLVIEAALPSGSLITARFALEQGREVFAVPGSVDNPRARGCHQLLREGAALAESAADILAELAPGLRAVRGEPRVADAGEKRAGKGGQRENGGSEAKVLAQLGFDRVSLDYLVSATGLEVSELSAVLVQLEIAGRIDSGGGGYSLRGGGA